VFLYRNFFFLNSVWVFVDFSGNLVSASVIGRSLLALDRLLLRTSAHWAEGYAMQLCDRAH
jgi:hypothetical protein